MAEFTFCYTIILSFTAKKEMLRICGLFTRENGFGWSNCRPHTEEGKRFCALEIETNKNIKQLAEFLHNSLVRKIEGIRDDTNHIVYLPPNWEQPFG